jgi:hypothetical protein
MNLEADSPSLVAVMFAMCVLGLLFAGWPA